MQSGELSYQDPTNDRISDIGYAKLNIMKAAHPYFFFVIAMLAIMLFLASCTVDTDAVKVNRWVVGITPDQGKTKILTTYRPLMEYIRAETGIDYEIRVPASSQQLLDWFRDKTINVALFGGVTFVKAQLQYNAIPVVRRDVDGSSSHYFLVRADIPARNLADLKGLRFAFGSRLSTSGHIMPHYDLQKSGIQPVEFFSEIRYSGAPDKTALMIQEGSVDAGAANTDIVRKMYQDGRLNQSKVRVLQQSLPYQGNVWAVQGSISQADIIKLRKAFLGLSCEQEKHGGILGLLEAGYYIPARHEDFEKITSAVSEHGTD